MARQTNAWHQEAFQVLGAPCKVTTQQGTHMSDDLKGLSGRPLVRRTSCPQHDQDVLTVPLGKICVIAERCN
jgi:hypothetical protein